MVSKRCCYPEACKKEIKNNMLCEIFGAEACLWLKVLQVILPRRVGTSRLEIVVRLARRRLNPKCRAS
jgi:hypothetical protein